MFTVTGKINGKPYTVHYDEGKLTGDKVPVDLAQIISDAKTGHPVGVHEQYTFENHMKDPLSAMLIFVNDVFDAGAAVSGDIPEAESVPEGAVV